MLVILHFLELGVWVFLCDLLLAWKSLGVMSWRVDIRNGAEKAELFSLAPLPKSNPASSSRIILAPTIIAWLVKKAHKPPCPDKARHQGGQ